MSRSIGGGVPQSERLQPARPRVERRGSGFAGSRNLNYTNVMPGRALKLGPDAVRQFQALSAGDRSGLKAAMQAALGEDDATVENRNRFRLRRPSGQSEFEFREGDLRVFYRAEDDQILVDAIGRKRGNQLYIGGRKVTI